MILLRAARCSSLARCLCQRCGPSAAHPLHAASASQNVTSAPPSTASPPGRSFAAAAEPSEQEAAIAEKLRAGLDNPVEVQVVDTSGGCGSMFQISAVAGDFRGKSIVKQHQLVTKILADEIATWHGFTLDLKAPK